MRTPVSAPLLAQMLAAEKARATTPTSQPVVLSEADLQDIDLAMHQRKQPLPGNPLVDGYEADRQARAIAIERGSRRHS